MGWNPCQSLKSFASSQPPLLMFTVCLMAFGLTMAILAYIIGVSEVPNPDVMDWNKFLSKLIEVDMCIPEKTGKVSVHNSHDNKPTVQPIMANMTHNISSVRLVDRSRSMSAVLSSVVDSVSGEVTEDHTVVNISVKVHLIISGPSSSINSLPPVVQGSISSKVLELYGRKASQILNVTIYIPPMMNVSCEKSCHTIQEVCLTIQVPSSLLPHTKTPEKCEQNPKENVVKVDFFQSHSKVSCLDNDSMHLEYITDPHLTEMLSLTERSIVNLHLMHTSYFMFVMVTTLLCYALIKGRYPQTKIVVLEKVPLDP